MLAQELGPDGEVVREWDDTPSDFGRIAASTAKQVIVQRLRDAEHEQTFGEYAGKEGDIVSGIVQAHDRRNVQGTVLIDIGKVEAVLPQAEQVPGEEYAHGSRLKAYVVSVARTFRGPQVDRLAHPPHLVRKLFALEVPEIADGSVEIVAVAREAGHRSKIAVRTKVPGLNAKGACIGPMGQRVRNVMSELHGEKIDIVDWSDDPATFVASALSARRGSTARPVVDPQAKAVARRRPGLPAVAGDRQGGAERPPGRPADRLPDRHPQRRAGRGRRRDAVAGRGPAAAAVRAAPLPRGGRPAAHRPAAPTRGTSRVPPRARVQGGRNVDPGTHLCGVPGARSGHRSAACRRPVRGSGPGSAAAAPRTGSVGAPHPECLHAAERRRAFPRALRLPGGGSPLEAGPLRDHVLGTSSEAAAERAERASNRSPSRTGTRPVRTSTGHRRMSQP